MQEYKNGEIVGTKHQIELKTGSVPKYQNSYQQGLPMADATSKLIRQNIYAVVIDTWTSEWASNVVLVPKMDGSVRFCVKCLRLNPATVMDTFPRSRMEYCLDKIGD